MKCVVCSKEVEGKRQTCSIKCRVAKSRMLVKSSGEVEKKDFEGKKNNADKCEFVGMKLCMKAKNPQNPCKTLHQFWICGRHQEHIEMYCEVMCNGI